jgi:DnaJ-class molecular chaperone
MPDKLPTPCEHCKGTGLSHGVECRECRGKGYRLILNGPSAAGPKTCARR